MDMLTREYAAQAQAAGDRLITGIAVPYDDEIEYMPGWFETVARDAFNPETNGPIKLFWQHSDVIGTVTDARNTPEGLEITARISETSLGNDVYALARTAPSTDSASDSSPSTPTPAAATTTAQSMPSTPQLTSAKSP